MHIKKTRKQGHVSTALGLRGCESFKTVVTAHLLLDNEHLKNEMCVAHNTG